MTEEERQNIKQGRWTEDREMVGRRDRWRGRWLWGGGSGRREGKRGSGRLRLD